MQNSIYALIFSSLADSFENAYQLVYLTSWLLRSKCWLASEINTSWPLSHTSKCYHVIQAWNTYHLAAGNNWNTSWPVSNTGKIYNSWQKEKSSWLLKKIIWLVVEVKFTYRLSMNQLQDIIIISLFTHCNKNNGTIKKEQLILHFNSSRCHLWHLLHHYEYNKHKF